MQVCLHKIGERLLGKLTICIVPGYSSVQPKLKSNFGIGIGNFFFRNRNFFFNFYLNSNFSHVLQLPWDISFYKLENKPRSSKVIQKYLIFDCILGFRDHIMMKKYLILSVTRFFFRNVLSVLVSVSVTVSAESIGQFGFRYWYQT